MRRSKITAIVLAAGKGERLNDLTAQIPKPMLRVRGEIILAHNLQWLKNNGLNNIFINLHHQPDVIKRHFTDGKNWGLHIQYSFEETLLGTAGAVKKIFTEYSQEFSSGPILVIYGDNFYPTTYNLNAMIAVHEKNQRDLTIGLYPNADKANTRHCGVALRGKDNIIKHFIEKPPIDLGHPVQDDLTKEILTRGYLNAAVYLLGPRVLEFIPTGVSDFGKDIFPRLLKNNFSVYGHVFSESPITVDTLELYQKTNTVPGVLIP